MNSRTTQRSDALAGFSVWVATTIRQLRRLLVTAHVGNVPGEFFLGRSTRSADYSPISQEGGHRGTFAWPNSHGSLGLPLAILMMRSADTAVQDWRSEDRLTVVPWDRCGMALIMVAAVLIGAQQ